MLLLLLGVVVSVFLLGVGIRIVVEIVRSKSLRDTIPFEEEDEVIVHGEESTTRLMGKTLIFLGSGGHTSEMFQLLDQVDTIESHLDRRVYVIANTDSLSEAKALEYEKSRFGNESKVDVYHVHRSREVGQSYITSVFSTLKSLLGSFPLVYREKPDLILVNGPGSCVPICLAAFLFKVLGVCDPTIVYVESLCRVTSLSLSAKILRFIVDACIIQWDEQKQVPFVVHVPK
eukprot:m.52722 g.52722  ORF g.52722 m.52722 type:complete len:231 (+) comp7631_c0_seq1:139-831(+)